MSQPIRIYFLSCLLVMGLLMLFAGLSHDSAQAQPLFAPPAQVTGEPPSDTPTNTPNPPSVTPSDTPTSTPNPPSVTPSDTPTNTPVPPSNTATDTATNTPIPPS